MQARTSSRNMPLARSVASSAALASCRAATRAACDRLLSRMMSSTAGLPNLQKTTVHPIY